MSFDWQTEEDVDWDDPVEPEKKPDKPRRRWPWAALVMVILLATAVFVIVREVSQRVEVATDNVEDELLATVTVIQNAAADMDVELFTGFLSGRDPDWASASEQVVANDAYLHRDGFGLQWIPIEPETAVISTTLSTRLQSAEVLSEYAYELDVGNGVTDTIHLQHTTVYRKGPNRWLLAPPESDFWGETLQLETEHFTLTYPARDERVAQKLAADLAIELAGVCYLLEDDCAPDFHLELELSTDPRRLRPLELADIEGASYELPAPTLVGIPHDSRSYDALYRGYAAPVVLAMLSTSVPKQCCGGELMYQMALMHILQQVGIWSGGRELVRDTAVDWQVLKETEATTQSIDQLWDELWLEGELSPQQEQLAKALLIFLMTETDATPVDLLRLTAQQPGTLLPELSAAWQREPWADGRWEREWQQSILRALPEKNVLETVPEQDLLMLCRPDWTDKFALYRHDFTAGTTLLAQDFNYRFAYGQMVGLADDSGIAMTGYRELGGQASPFLLRGNVRHDIVWERGDFPVSQLLPVKISPTGGSMVWFDLDGGVDGMPYGVLDVDECLNSYSCELNMGTSNPIWGPNDEQMIGQQISTPFPARMGEEALLSLRSGDGADLMAALGFGGLPFWIDEETFGYIQSDENGRSELFSAKINEDSGPNMLISENDLILALPEIGWPLFIDFVQFDPNDPNILLLMVGYDGGAENGRILLAYDLETEEFEIRWTLEPEYSSFSRLYNISPDNEWLLTDSFTYTSDQGGVYLLHDLQSGATITLPRTDSLSGELFYDWSANGDWLAYPSRGMVQLFNPDEGVYHHLIADGLTCWSAVWTNKAHKVTNDED